MNKKTYNIPAISCMHCVNTIVRELSALEGVLDVSGDAAARTITVEYGDSVDEKDILNLLAEIGYPAGPAS